MTWELVYGAAMVWGNAVSAKLVHFACLAPHDALGISTHPALLGRGGPLVGRGCVCRHTHGSVEATTAYVDLALALYAGLAVYALLVYAETEERGWLIACRVEPGICAGYQHLALFMWVIAVGTLCVLVWAFESELGARHVHRCLICGRFPFAAVAVVRPQLGAGWQSFFPRLLSAFRRLPT